jgi:glycosyltransferase involved in cell wall biosynthesis
VVNRPNVKRFWKAIERFAIPRVDAAYTVSKGYANLFDEEYQVDFGIVRNATILREQPKNCDKSIPYILYQGAVNYGRGLEELIEAMKTVDCQLYICGDGDILPQLKEQVINLNLSNKVKFMGFVEPEKLREYTCGATIGLTLFAKAGLSHWHSLANRFFDYMHAGVPQIAMTYPEYMEFNKKDEIAVLIDNIEPENISTSLNKLLVDKDLCNKLSENALKAREHANWQAQEKVLIGIYNNL